VSDLDSKQAMPKLPRLQFGFALVAFVFVSQIVWGAQRALHPYLREAGGYAAAATIMGELFLGAYLLYCISVYHHAVSQVEGWRHPITPRRAVRFHFIPVFNIYWNYKWPGELARFVNWRTQRRRMSGVLVGTVVLLGFLVGGLLDASLGAVIVLCAFAYVSRCLRDAFAAPHVPTELHGTSGLDAAALPTQD